MITASFGNAESLQTIALLLEQDAPASRAAFHDALKEHFGGRVTEDPVTALHIADYSISIASSELPLYSSDTGASDTPPIEVVLPRKSNWADECESFRARATLAIFQIEDGALVSRSTAEAIICQGDEAPYDDLARVLIKAVNESKPA